MVHQYGTVGNTIQLLWFRIIVSKSFVYGHCAEQRCKIYRFDFHFKYIIQFKSIKFTRKWHLLLLLHLGICCSCCRRWSFTWKYICHNYIYSTKYLVNNVQVFTAKVESMQFLTISHLCCEQKYSKCSSSTRIYFQILQYFSYAYTSHRVSKVVDTTTLETISTICVSGAAKCAHATDNCATSRTGR